MASPIVGTPKPQDWDKNIGFTHVDPRVDDNMTLAAGQGRYPNKVVQDVGALEIQYDRMTNGHLDFNRERIVPHWVAERGAQSLAHRQNVEGLIGDIFRQNPGMDRRLYPEFIQTYRDAVDAASFGTRW
jgi:hypothetical protein